MQEFLYKIRKNMSMKGIKRFFRSRFTVNDSFTEMQKSWLPDKYYLKKKYKLMMHRELNLKNPLTFTEKLNWIKLYDRRPEYTMMVDKYAVRQYVKEKIGEEYLVPLIGVWEKVEDIDFDSLPNQFVLKCTHDCGAYICRDKSQIDTEEIKQWLKYHLGGNYYKWQREWPYRNVKRKVICERYMQDNNNASLLDYKFFCYNGTPRFLYITQHINGKEYINFFNENFQPIDVKREDLECLSIDYIKKPNTFEAMKDIAHSLSEGLYWVRVDLYDINGEIYCGELTFFPTGGFIPFESEEWDYKFGELLRLPDKKRRW